jgi:hypothetical protein
MYWLLTERRHGRAQNQYATDDYTKPKPEFKRLFHTVIMPSALHHMHSPEGVILSRKAQ